MSGLDKMTDEKLRLIASAIRQWTGALDHAGLPPTYMVSAAEQEAVCELMGLYPQDPMPGDGEEESHGTEPVDHS